MQSKIITVTRTDQIRLNELLDSEWIVAIGGQRPHLHALREKLADANVVDSCEMQPDIVTMNSTIYLKDLDRNTLDVYTLVYPAEACIAEGKLSILSPLGTAVFGSGVGETLTLQVLQNQSHKQIKRLSFQPERVGAFNL
ncbi:regulator of nucleoside diphosphate kinase [Neorhodopirellula lusitana]|uniref:Regulator of nucleoside diphosphate kinase n=1 Tax=Neorhodopirellula lusitana TaxID=445327 RepID=A0ABY1PQ88_9BACT|nr:GreA/GreB family elongation factor [Neorhodopirellula lusitana]SMP39003.1 regulator of nucleoside diphosphate kinase [Neorhodopirellula lusitana]